MSLAIVVVGPDVPPEDEATAEILAVIATALPGSDEDVPDTSLHTTPSALADAAELDAAMTAAAADPAATATRRAEARRRAVRLSAIDEQALDRPEQTL